MDFVKTFLLALGGILKFNSYKSFSQMVGSLPINFSAVIEKKLHSNLAKEGVPLTKK